MFNPNIQRALVGKKVKPETIRDKLTNRELREKNLLSIVRRIKPAVPRALKKMVFLLSKDSPNAVRMKAAKFIIEEYLSIVKVLYKQQYDSEEGTDIQASAGYFVDDTNIVQIQEKSEEPEQLLKTNKHLRSRQFLLLSRKFKPHIAEALKTINELVDTEGIDPNVRFQASKFMIQISKGLTADIYKDEYDEEQDDKEIIEKEIAPVFSLVMVKKEIND